MIKVSINGVERTLDKSCSIGELVADFDVFVRNGYGITKDSIVEDGDKIIAVKKGKMVSNESLRKMLNARNGEYVTSSLENACVCICGLGGLGSNIACMLARLGVGKLILIDYDIVDLTNLNRQNYFISDIGCYKTEAISKQLKNINPYVQIVTHNLYVDSENILHIIDNCNVVIEAFDNPICKAELVNSILQNTDKYIIASSGMAGYGSSNEIKTAKYLSRLYVAGDSVTEAREGVSLMSPRVNICAGHMANMALRILLGEFEAWLFWDFRFLNLFAVRKNIQKTIKNRY